MRRLLIGIIILAIFVRIFVLVVLPDAALNDSLFHLMTVQDIMEAGTLPYDSVFDWVVYPGGELPPPLPYIILAYIYIFTGIPFVMPFLKFMPVLMSALSLLFAYLLFKKLLGDKWLLAFAFVAINTWLITYSSVNYTGIYAATLVLAGLYFLTRFLETRNSTFIWLSFFLIACLAITKLNGTLVAIVMFPTAIYIYLRHLGFLKRFNKTNVIFPLIILCILINLIIPWKSLVYNPMMGINPVPGMDGRNLLPTIALYGFVFAYGYYSLFDRNKEIDKNMERFDI